MGTLYIVGTPIGNLGDFSPRAVSVLEGVDFIAAEDTRVTVKLLNHFGIKKPLVSYYEHNKRDKGEQILNRIKNGESCAIVSDAGMPCISDPGEELVNEAHKHGVNVVVVPGPSAVISALAVSGMKSGRFTFEGFLSVNRPSRRKHLAEIQNEKRTMVFYEAPHKLVATLKDLYETLGNREITIARELTKIHEEIKKTTLLDAFNYYSENAPKGEFVLLIEGKPEKEENYSFADAVNFAKEWVKKGESATTAAKRAAELTGFKKSEIYKELY